jgi:hypothetical protein
MRLKIIELKIHFIIYMTYNKFIIINIIISKNIPKFLNPICNNNKK